MTEAPPSAAELKQLLLSLSIYWLTTVIGAAAFLYPFWLPGVQQSSLMTQAHTADSPFMLTALVGLCFVVVLLEVQGAATSAKFVALLGILVAINSVLRFVEVAIPGPGGFSPIFFLIVLTGYVYGGRFGFLMGALTLFVSALVTGTVGPWLPYQMFTAGWIGMSAPLCKVVTRLFRLEGGWAEVAVLALFGGAWGIVYGGIMNIWFWPFAMGPIDQHWQPGIPILEAFRRYAAFYVATSFIWDAMRAFGNILFMALFGQAVLRALRRFQKRFAFQYRPAEAGGRP